MIIDSRCELSIGAQLPAIAGKVALAATIDLGRGDKPIGAARGLTLVVAAVSNITAATAGTLRFVVVSDAQSALAIDGSATEHFSSGRIAIGTQPIPAGRKLLCVPLPMGFNYEQYLGLLQDATVAPSGRVEIFLTPTPAVAK